MKIKVNEALYINGKHVYPPFSYQPEGEKMATITSVKEGLGEV